LAVIDKIVEIDFEPKFTHPIVVCASSRSRENRGGAGTCRDYAPNYLIAVFARRRNP